MDCGSPGFPKDGDTIIEGTTYNLTVTHYCNEGYILIGDKNRTCHGNGTWSGVFPECKREYYPSIQKILFNLLCISV